jgi:hypothetical protein
VAVLHDSVQSIGPSPLGGGCDSPRWYEGLSSLTTRQRRVYRHHGPRIADERDRAAGLVGACADPDGAVHVNVLDVHEVKTVA